jgi:hypothetical protein
MRPAFGPAACSDGHYAWQTKEGEEGGVKLKFDAPRDGKYWFIGRVSGNVANAPWNLSVDGGKRVPLLRNVIESAWEWQPWPEGAELKKGPHEIELSTTHRGAAADVVLVTTDAKWKPARLGTADEAPPSPVEKLEITGARAYDIALSWPAVRDDDIHHYNIYSSRDGGPKVEQRCLIASPAAPPFLDWGLRPGTEYAYVVTAVDRRGNESPPSPVVKGKTAPLAGAAAIKVAADAFTFEPPVTKSERKGVGCVAVPPGKDVELSVPFETAADGTFMIWAQVVADKGSATLYPRLDGKDLGRWMIYYDQSALGGGVAKDSDWVWTPIVVRPYPQQGRFVIPAGKHTLTLKGSGLFLGGLVITSDHSFRPEGKVGTLYLY